MSQMPRNLAQDSEEEQGNDIVIILDDIKSSSIDTQLSDVSFDDTCLKTPICPPALDIYMYCCQICNNRYTSRRNLLRHTKNKHFNHVNDKDRKKDMEEAMELPAQDHLTSDCCEICQKSNFCSKRYLVRHYKNVHNIPCYMVGGQIYAIRDNLLPAKGRILKRKNRGRNLCESDQGQSIGNTQVPDRSCTLCEQTFSSRYMLAHHLQSQAHIIRKYYVQQDESKATNLTDEETILHTESCKTTKETHATLKTESDNTLLEKNIESENVKDVDYPECECCTCCDDRVNQGKHSLVYEFQRSKVEIVDSQLDRCEQLRGNTWCDKIEKSSEHVAIDEQYYACEPANCEQKLEGKLTDIDCDTMEEVCEVTEVQVEAMSDSDMDTDVDEVSMKRRDRTATAMSCVYEIGNRHVSVVSIAQNQQGGADQTMFVCFMCNMRFQEICELTEHMEIHSTTKPFVSRIY